MTKNENIWLASIFFISLLFKIVLLKYAQTVDCDAVSRIFISMDWYENPHWIRDGVWLPFHFYLNGFAFWIYNDRELSPAILNILFSCFSIFPFYYFVKREFYSPGAFYSCLLFVASPLLSRNSLMPLSETPFWFFVIITLSLISKGMHSKKNSWFFIGGLMAFIAAGIRFEAWLLIPLLSALIFLNQFFKIGINIQIIHFKKFAAGKKVLLNKGFQNASVFLIISSLFPVLWMYYSYQNTGTLFHPDAPVFYAKEVGIQIIDWESWARKGWFYPLSWVLAVGPLTAFYILKYMIRSKQADPLKPWIFLIISIMIVILYKSLTGSIMLQHRFSGIIVLLTIPFFSFFECEKIKSKKIILTLIIFSTVGLSFVYNTVGIAAIPRLKDKKANDISKILNENINIKSTLLIDFDGWENTWYYGLKSGLKPENILINYQNENLGEIIEKWEKKYYSGLNGTIILKKGSTMENFIKEKNWKKNFDLISVFENEKCAILKSNHP